MLASTAFVSCPRAHCGWDCMAKSPCCTCKCLSLSGSLWPQSSSLEEASARTLLVMTVDGCKYQQREEHTHVMRRNYGYASRSDGRCMRRCDSLCRCHSLGRCRQDEKGTTTDYCCNSSMMRKALTNICNSININVHTAVMAGQCLLSNRNASWNM